MWSLNSLVEYGISTQIIDALTGKQIYNPMLFCLYIHKNFADLKIDLQLLRQYSVKDILQLKIKGLTYCKVVEIKRACKKYMFQYLLNENIPEIQIETDVHSIDTIRTGRKLSDGSVVPLEESTSSDESLCNNQNDNRKNNFLNDCRNINADSQKDQSTTTFTIKNHRLLLTINNVSREVIIIR